MHETPNNNNSLTKTQYLSLIVTFVILETILVDILYIFNGSSIVGFGRAVTDVSIIFIFLFGLAAFVSLGIENHKLFQLSGAMFFATIPNIIAVIVFHILT